MPKQHNEPHKCCIYFNYLTIFHTSLNLKVIQQHWGADTAQGWQLKSKLRHLDLIQLCLSLNSKDSRQIITDLSELTQYEC